MAATSVVINNKPHLKKLYSSISELETPELVAIAQQVNKLVAIRSKPVYSEYEESLIKKIKKQLPLKFQKRYNDLLKKLEDETMTEAENKEFLAMLPISGNHSVERLCNFVELSKFWNTTVDDVMNRLGIKAPKDV